MILTILKNRTDLGEVQFRGTWSKDTHSPLVEKSIFGAAQAILSERSEDVSKRASQQIGLPADRLGGLWRLWLSLHQNTGHRAQRHLRLLHLRRPPTQWNENLLF